MTREEFTPLKEFCDNNGYELLNIDHEDNEKFFVIVKKKDPWKEVEFILNKVGVDMALTEGKIYKITSFEHHSPGAVEPMVICDSSEEVFCLKEFSEPSTEAEYVEQKQGECFERFGPEIDTSKIDGSNMDGGRIVFDKSKDSPFLYRKDTDTLYACGVPLYQAGKWATRISNRIKVTPGFYKSKGDNYMRHVKCSFEVQNLNNSADTSEVMNFLSSQLEKFLNGEIE